MTNKNQRLSNIKLGIFDHSGVLSDDRIPVYNANMILLDKYGISRITFEEWRIASKASARDLVHSFGVNAPAEKIDREYEEAYTKIGSRTENPIRPTMYEDAPELLRILKEEKRIRLAIVSSHPKSNLIKELDEYGIIDFFDEISGDPAPKTQRLKSICEKFQIKAGNAFFVEDTVYGLRSGHQAGVNCFGITTGYHSRERLEVEKTAFAVVDSLTELLDHI